MRRSTARRPPGEAATSPVGYHASHEQFGPDQLLAWSQLAVRHGFGGAMCSDHFLPWSVTQGQSGFAWSWLGAALATTPASFGVVTAPVERYHPAIIAQAAATLGVMFPGRFWLAVGSGEALNEHISGAPWRSKAQRNARLAESVHVMRGLFRGEEVTFEGRHVFTDRARLWTRPERPPLLLGAALSEETARWVGDWADGLITVAGPRDMLKRRIAAFRKTAGPKKPVYLQVQLAWAKDEKTALREAHRNWRFPALGATLTQTIATPEEFDDATRHVRPDDLRPLIRISADLEQHTQWLQEDLDLGVEQVFLHNVVPNQVEFLEAFGRRVLPKLQSPKEAPR